MARSFLMYGALIPLLLLSSSAYAQSKGDGIDRQYKPEGNFYCVAEWSEGGSYNHSTKRWEATRFRIDNARSKFVLKAKYYSTHLNGYSLYDVHTVETGSNSRPGHCITDDDAYAIMKTGQILSDVMYTLMSISLTSRQIVS